ncbi:MAG: DUF6807 family protein [Verrucomicrobiota bacterium]
MSWLLATTLACGIATHATAADNRIHIQHDPDKGKMTVIVDGRPAIEYNYGSTVDLPHYYPVYSPSGKSLTVQFHPKRDPHHRSFYFADRVRFGTNAAVTFYSCYYSRLNPGDPQSPFTNHIRHVQFLPEKITNNEAEFGMKQVWEMNMKVPVLDQLSQVRFVALGSGEYFMDLRYTVTASYGDVRFVSDDVHYAWPFIRMAQEYSAAKGGRLINSHRQIGQKATHGQAADWVDYSNTLGGITEGIACFANPDIKEPQRWLTRDYGIFGVRRVDDKNGRPFTLKRGECIKQHVGVLVHSGNEQGGKVAQRYQQFLNGTL